MELFIGNSPIPKNFTISASDEIMIEVGIQKEDRRLKVVVSECWATPTNNSMDPLSFPFIHDRYCMHACILLSSKSTPTLKFNI